MRYLHQNRRRNNIIALSIHYLPTFVSNKENHQKSWNKYNFLFSVGKRMEWEIQRKTNSLHAIYRNPHWANYTHFPLSIDNYYYYNFPKLPNVNFHSGRGLIRDIILWKRVSCLSREKNKIECTLLFTFIHR